MKTRINQQNQESALLTAPVIAPNSGLVLISVEALSELIKREVKEAIQEIKEEEENSTDSEFYTRKEVADKWHVDEVTVWRHEKLGDIHAMRRGRRVLYLKEEIDNYDHKMHDRTDSSLYSRKIS